MSKLSKHGKEMFKGKNLTVYSEDFYVTYDTV